MTEPKAQCRNCYWWDAEAYAPNPVYHACHSLQGELDGIITIEEEELAIARLQPWGGSPAIFASDGLFSFGAHIEAYVTAAQVLVGDASAAREHLLALNMYPDDFSWRDWLQRWHKDPGEAERVLAPIRDLAQNERARGYDALDK